MPRSGYLGGPIIRPGAAMPIKIGELVVSNIARATGLSSHVANIKRCNIFLDAAVIVARQNEFLKSEARVGLSTATRQNFGATSGQHAAHGVKRFVFDDIDIVAVYNRKGVDEVLLMGLETMLSLVTDVHSRANLSIDKRLEANPKRLLQLQAVVNSSVRSLAEAQSLARELEFQRRFFDKALLQSMKGAFGGDANYNEMLSQYEAVLSAPPPADESPELIVNMTAGLIEV